jgi:hypothetical protein
MYYCTLQTHYPLTMALCTLLQTSANSATGTISSEFRTAFNRDVLIRFYPNSASTKGHSLIGINKLAQIVEDKEVFIGMMSRLDNCEQDRLVVKLRRGVAFSFILR